MSNVELNEVNVKKFSKRLHKSLVEKNIDITLSESKELFAKSLGFNNYYSLSNSIEKIKNVENEKKINTQKELFYAKDIWSQFEKMNIERNEQNITPKEKAELFYNKFMLSLNVIDSSIKKCIFGRRINKNKECPDNYFIGFQTIFNDKASISMSENFLSSEQFNYLIEKGIKREDAINIIRSFCLHDPFYENEIIIGKFEMRELSEDLFNFIKVKKNIENDHLENIILKDI